MSGQLLIRGGIVLTLGSRTPNHARGDVLVDDHRVAEIGPNLRARGAEVIEAEDCIVMPGFVDTHRHLWRSLFRNFGAAGGSLPPSPAEYGHHYGPDDVYAGILIGLLGALEAGITTVVDFADIPTGEAYVDAALQAHADSGARSVLALAAAGWAGSVGDVMPELRRISARRPHPSTALGSPTPGHQDLDRIAALWVEARSLGMRIHAHAGVEPAHRGLVAEMAAREALGPDVTLVHCSHLGAGDLDAIAATRTAVSIAPASEMALGLGAPPMQGLLDRGIRPGLGVDQDALAPGDIFAAMRAANSIQHATLFDLKLAGKAGIPNLLTTRDVIRYATSAGARAAGLEAVTGSLEPGKQADLIVLRTDRPNIAPVNDPIGAVVWGMDTSNIEWVLVAGEPVFRHGQLTTDSAWARDLAVAAHRRVTQAAGLTAGLGTR